MVYYVLTFGNLKVDPGLPAYTAPDDGTTGDCPAGDSTCGAVSTTPPGTEWMTVTCTDPSVTNAAINPWVGTYCDEAWAAAIFDWQSANEGSLSFPQGVSFIPTVFTPSWATANFSPQVSNFFHGPPNLDCDVLQDSNTCATSLKCDNIVPAGYVIIDCFTNIYNVHQASPSPR